MASTTIEIIFRGDSRDAVRAADQVGGAVGKADIAGRRSSAPLGKVGTAAKVASGILIGGLAVGRLAHAA